jgi:DNA-binding SARP family transcriptional activator
MDIRFLGPLEASERGQSVPLGGPKQRLVLVALALNANRTVSVDRIIEAVWGDHPPKTARLTVQSYVSHLRRALGTERIVTRGDGYELVVGPNEVDVARFEELADEGRRLLADDPEAAAERLDAALALWRGTPFANGSLPPAIQMEADRLEERRIAVLEDRADSALARGEHVQLVGELEQLIAEHPLRERMWGQLMLALYRAGRQADALRVFERLRESLAEELGIDPSAQLRELHRRILQQDPDLDPAGAAMAGRLGLLLTDIEDSTPLWEADPEGMAAAVAEQDRLISAAVRAHGGRVVARTGDAIDAVFTDTSSAVRAAIEAQRELSGIDSGGLGALRVRMAIDAG